MEIYQTIMKYEYLYKIYFICGCKHDNFSFFNDSIVNSMEALVRKAPIKYREIQKDIRDRES